MLEKLKYEPHGGLENSYACNINKNQYLMSSW